MNGFLTSTFLYRNLMNITNTYLRYIIFQLVSNIDFIPYCYTMMYPSVFYV